MQFGKNGFPKRMSSEKKVSKTFWKSSWYKHYRKKSQSQHSKTPRKKMSILQTFRSALTIVKLLSCSLREVRRSMQVILSEWMRLTRSCLS